MRSLLLVSYPGADNLLAAQAGGPDAIVLDLASPSRAARGGVPDEIGPRIPTRHHVRVHGLATGLVDDELDRVMPSRPEAILLQDTRGGSDVARLGTMLAVREAELGIDDGATRIVAVVSSSAGALALGSLPGSSRRLGGIGWDAPALAADLGLSPIGEPWPAPCLTARGLVLLAAAAAQVLAIDTPSPDGLGLDRLEQQCRRARRDGFRARLASRPAEVPVINAIFSRVG